MAKMYNIHYKNGSNEIEIFKTFFDFLSWWDIMTVLSNRTKGSIKWIEVIK